MILIGLFLSAYLLGAIPFAVLLGRIKKVDILRTGSGNPGMTNVWRTMGPVYGILCFALDILKGLLPALAARILVPHALGVLDAQFIWFMVAVAAVVGHCWSVFLRFKGGKAVSTSLGAILGTSPLVAVCCLAVFGLVLLITRYVALASVIGVVSVIVFNRVFPGQSVQLLPVFFAISAMVAIRHRANFVRMLNGTEPKVGSKRVSRAES